MKRSARFPSLFLILAFALVAAPAFARPDAATTSPAPASPGFEKLKSLAGNWEGKDGEGHPVEVSYKLVSNGSVLMEEISHGGMVTMYHQDGDRLMMTHYCMTKNQPRMRTEPIKGDPKTLDFKFLDVTNLAKPTDMVMKGLKIAFLDADHFTAEWLMSQDGKETPETMSFERKK